MEQEKPLPDSKQPDRTPKGSDGGSSRPDGTELSEAFELFNQMSAQLSENYQELEQRVALLTDELQRTALQRQQEVSENERLTSRLQSLLKLLPGGLIVLDGSGRVQECNPAAEQLLGSPLLGEAWIKVIQRCFAPRVDDGHDVSLKDGRRVHIATRSLESGPGQIMLLTDQTETRALQDSLSHYQRLSSMGKMMASLAHQIRTPLSAAMLYSAHLTKPELPTEQRVRFAGKVKSRLASLEQQVQDMLIFARGETKLSDLISTEQLFRELEDALDVPLANADADCELINDTPGLLLSCHREVLIGALINLVNNALQAAGNGTELLIRSRRLDERRLELSVEDQGPGMDAELLSKAQQPFYTTKSHGTGLGLAVAQVVARAHHGEFCLSSTVGKGTQAGFILPFIQPSTPSGPCAPIEQNSTESSDD
jgi:two-component system sensor histidine kinase FlrB